MDIRIEDPLLKSVQEGGIDSKEPRKTTVRQGGQEISRGAEQPPIAPYPRLQVARTQEAHKRAPEKQVGTCCDSVQAGATARSVGSRE